MRNQGRNRGSTFSRLHVMMAELGLSSATQLKRPMGTCGQDPMVGCWAQWAGAGQPESLGSSACQCPHSR